MNLMNREDSRSYLSTVEQTAQFAADRDVSLADVFTAQAKAYPEISGEGIYLRIQAAILRFVGPIGGILLVTLGVASFLVLLKRAGGWLLEKLRTDYSGFLAFLTPAAAIGAGLTLGSVLIRALTRWIGDGPVRDAQDEAASAVLSGLTTAMVAVAPAPLGLLVNSATDILESAISGRAGPGMPTASTSPASSTSLVSSLTPFAAPALSTLGPSGAGGAVNLAASILSTPAAQSVVGGVVDWIGGLFGDRYIEADHEERQALASSLKQTLLEHGCSEAQANHIVTTLSERATNNDRYVAEN